MNTILSSRGVTPEMQFVCSDCREVTTGQEIIDGERIYIVKANLVDLHRSIWRCQCCQDDVDDLDRD